MTFRLNFRYKRQTYAMLKVLTPVVHYAPLGLEYGLAYFVTASVRTGIACSGQLKHQEDSQTLIKDDSSLTVEIYTFSNYNWSNTPKKRLHEGML